MLKRMKTRHMHSSNKTRAWLSSWRTSIAAVYRHTVWVKELVVDDDE